MEKKLKILGFFIWSITIILSLMWYDWKLLLILFLALFANNLERTNNK